jgi:hypothetical protein
MSIHILTYFSIVCIPDLALTYGANPPIPKQKGTPALLVGMRAFVCHSPNPLFGAEKNLQQRPQVCQKKNLYEKRGSVSIVKGHC